MRTLKYLFISGLTCFNCLSQTKGDYVFRTDFNQEDQQLILKKTKALDLYTEDGVYYMNIKKTDTLYDPSFLLPVDPDKDFIMMTSMKSLSGNTSFGLSFGDGFGNIKYAFLIYNRGGFEIYKQTGNVSGIIAGPSFSPFIKKDRYNTLLVEKIGNSVYFFVNYQLLACVPFSPFKGRSYGLFVPGGQEIACDYFYVKQKRKPINLIENYNTFGVPIKFELADNTGYAQTAPVISADGEVLYYTSVDNQGKKPVFHPQFCQRSKNGNWETPKLPFFPGSEKNISVAGLSFDKNEILLSSGVTFSSSCMVGQNWSIPKALPFKSSYSSSSLGTGLCPSGDFKTLVMALEQQNGYGVTDLYVSFFRDSVWTTPLNLGKNINSFGDEISPFLAPDNKTLYFASDGWPGYGRYDIFMSTRLDDSWTRWSEPKNLGPMINTNKGDIYYNTSASGDEAYLARSTKEDRFFHIYRITQPRSAAPEPIVLIQGRVLDSETGRSLSAIVTYSVSGKPKETGSVRSDRYTGVFAISLPKGKKYVFSAYKKGYFSEQRSPSTVDLKEYREEKVELLLTSLKSGGTIIMHDLFFPNNQATLLPESETELSRLYALLLENKSLKIEILGHTQLNDLSRKFNYDLSLSRAEAVRDYLIRKGIAPERLVARGYGNSQPIETNGKDEASQAKNRRVEFRIIRS